MKKIYFILIMTFFFIACANSDKAENTSKKTTLMQSNTSDLGCFLIGKTQIGR